MHRQCPVSYNNSYAYSLTTYIIIVIVDPPSVSACTYLDVRTGCTYLVGLYLLVLTWITYLLVFTDTYLDYLRTYLYLLVLTYLLTYLLVLT